MTSPPPHHSLSSPATGQRLGPVLPTPSSSTLNQRSPKSQRSGEEIRTHLPSPSSSSSGSLLKDRAQASVSLLPPPLFSTGTTPTKRRSKVPNNDRRNTDIEFATEIGQGLLLEVRKMQALLQEKEEQLRVLQTQKADLERAAETMAKQLLQREQNEERLKEETWNLELAKQELTISVTELQQNLTKANAEYNRIAKQANALRAEIDSLRDREEKLQAMLETMKARHENDMSVIRRHAASLQREKQDQSKQIESLKSELAIAKAQSRIGKHAHEDEELASDEDESPLEKRGKAAQRESAYTLPSSVTPERSLSRNQAMEVETLKTSLAHAHRMVSNLRSNLYKEKTEKFELKKLLAETQETIEHMQNDPRMWEDAGAKSPGFRHDDVPPSPRRPTRRKLGPATRKLRALGRLQPEDRSKLKPSAGNEDDMYSYASISEDEITDASMDESDVEPRRTLSLSLHKTRFASLSSELSKSQFKPSGISTSTMTDPVVLLDQPADAILHASYMIVDRVTEEGIPVLVPHHVHPTDSGMQTEGLNGEVAHVFHMDCPPRVADICMQDAMVQCDQIPGIDQSMQSDAVYQSHVMVQCDQIPGVDQSMQSDGVEQKHVAVQSYVIDEVQSDEVQQSHVMVQCDQIPRVDQSMQSDIVEQNHMSVQSEPIVDIQSDIAQSHIMVQCDQMPGIDQSMQSDVVKQSHMAVQSDAIVDVQSKAVQQSHSMVQCDQIPGIDQSIQSDTVQQSHIMVQCDQVLGIDQSMQSVMVEQSHMAVQSEATSTAEVGMQSEPIEIEPIPTVHVGIQSEATTTAEVGMQSEPIEIEPVPTVHVGIQSEATSTAEVGMQSEPIEIESIPTVHMGIQSEAVSMEHRGIQHDDASTAAASFSISTQSESIAGMNKVIQSEAIQGVECSAQCDAPVTADVSVHTEPSQDGLDATAQCNPAAIVGTDMSIQSDLQSGGAVAFKNMNMPAQTATPKDIRSLTINTAADLASLSLHIAPRELANGPARPQLEEATQMPVAFSPTLPVFHDTLLPAESVPPSRDMTAEHSTTPMPSQRFVTQQDSTQDVPPRITRDPMPERKFTKDEVDTLIRKAMAREAHVLSGPILTLWNSEMQQETLNEANDSARPTGAAKELTMPVAPTRPANPPPAELLSKASLSQARLAGLASSAASKASSIDTEDYGTAVIHPSRRIMTGSAASLSSSVNTMDHRLSGSSTHVAGSIKSQQSVIDPTISIITQTMIGEWMYKYTRKVVGGALSENRHQRFFWIHPYTRTLYWSTHAPGVEGGESKAKSAFIESVVAVPDITPGPPGMPSVSLLIQTTGRQIKVTAPTRERHDVWHESLSYLMSRSGAEAATTVHTIARKGSSHRIQDILRGPHPEQTYSTPTGSSAIFTLPHHLHSSTSTTASHRLRSFDHVHDDDDDDDTPIEDVRMCCNGKHHVSKLEKRSRA